MSLILNSRIWMSLATVGLLWAQADPPSRVARLNFLNGAVSYRPDSVEDWAAASPNYPLTTGDHLWTEQGAGAEMHIGSTAVRLASQTAFAILNLDDRTAQVSLSQGILNVNIRNLGQDETFEVDTPNGAISLLRPGDYRIDVTQDDNSSAVTVRAGGAEVTGGGQAFPVNPGQQARFSGTDQITSGVEGAPPPDEWDQWCMDRDRRDERAFQASERYVPPDMVGAEDLGAYGVWRDDPMYGPVWVPTGMPVGWAPYRYGHWAYVAPWGWTWIDDAPWGFAPFHYGRWAMAGGGWVWVPGSRMGRPVYAPALVAFVGGRDFGVAIGVGGIGVAAWIPLGPREVYHPYYPVSEVYVRNVNVMHMTNISAVNVTNVTYANRTYVTAVRQDAFVGARPVAMAAVRVPPAAIARVQTVAVVDARPIRESYMGRPMQPGVRVAAPPARVMERTVIVKNVPPQTAHPIAPVRVAAPVRAGQPSGFRPVETGARPQIAPNAGRPINDRPAYARPAGNAPPQTGNAQPQVFRPNNDRTPASAARPAVTTPMPAKPSAANADRPRQQSKDKPRKSKEEKKDEKR
jgi:hypothetical protein